MTHDFVKPNWTNNNAESFNHVLKLDLNWRPNALNTFITYVTDLFSTLYLDMERAIIGRGQFVLHPQFIKFNTSADSWQKKNIQQREKYINNFLKTPRTTGDNYDITAQV